MKKWYFKIVVISIAILSLISIKQNTLAEQADQSAVIKCGDYAYIVLENGTAEIYAYSGTSKILILPTMLDGYSVSSIGSRAFYLSNVKELTIPDSVVNISSNAFSSCYSLSKLFIPDSVVSIEGNPFISCPLLKDITFAESNDRFEFVDNVLFSKVDHSLLFYPSWLTEEEYTVPQGTSSIKAGAFANCQNLKAIMLNNDLKLIGDSAFSGCEALKEITLSSSLEKIGSYAFSNCYQLSNVALPNNTKEIGDYAFRNCRNLSEITLPEGLITIGNAAFSSCRNLSIISLPSSIQKIGSNPFVECTSLKEIDVSQYNSVYSSDNGVLLSKDDMRIVCYPNG